MKTIDLNVDLGEGFPWDAELLPLVSSVCVACGGHAGDARTMDATLRGAKLRGVTAGAHPGYLDRANFGRIDREATAEEVRGLILEQWDALQAVASSIGIPLKFLKPHGALYNQARLSEPHALGIVEAAASLGMPVLGISGGLVESHAARRGVRFVSEGFADRRYRPDGSLVPRSEAGAVLDDPAEAAEQVLTLTERGIETLCIHGDHPEAVKLALAIRVTLQRSGIEVRSAF
ncbi:5-oxoprolinase subunit PxpA [Isosphaeraceae bacterium EP7]